MKADVFDINGKIKDRVDLPQVFSARFRPDVIKRAVLAIQSWGRQPYGADPMAGLRTSAHYHGKRRQRYTMINRDMARLPRIHAGPRHLSFRVRRIPRSVKGRKAHPPKAEKVWEQKINAKEYALAMRSAIAATAKKDVVADRGHKVSKIDKLPLIVDGIEKVNKTKDFERFLINLGLDEEIKRCSIKTMRAGKGTMRGRRYKRRIGPLIVIEKENGLKIGSNIQGVDVISLEDLTVEDLAPGAHPGRLTIWDKSALEGLK